MAGERGKVPKSAGRRYVVLLRGINVGGHNKVPMAALRATIESTGCTEVATYIQSGNAVLTSTSRPGKLRRALEVAIGTQLGAQPSIVVRTQGEMARVVAHNPFGSADPSTVHVAFLTDKPAKKAIAGLRHVDAAPEELKARGDEIYLHLPNGVGRAKLPVALDRVLPGGATIRNWRTVTTLLGMLKNAS